MNYSYNHFIVKLPLKLLVKLLLHSVFSLITWNIKLLRQKLANHRQQIFSNYEHISNCFNILLDLLDFLIYLAKYFWSILNLPNVIFQQYYVAAM